MGGPWGGGRAFEGTTGSWGTPGRIPQIWLIGTAKSKSGACSREHNPKIIIVFNCPAASAAIGYALENKSIVYELLMVRNVVCIS